MESPPSSLSLRFVFNCQGEKLRAAIPPCAVPCDAACVICLFFFLFPIRTDRFGGRDLLPCNQ
eukprot:m.484886 g.484886  ORF g.484886 m.484886 type:complete len:63 (-) comp57205_c0_seq2:25-213(-)